MSPPEYSALGFKDIIVSLNGLVAVVLINRAKQYVVHYCWSGVSFFILTLLHGCRRNSFGKTMVAELVHAFDLFDRDDRVRAVVMTAEHTAPAYCSGVSCCDATPSRLPGSDVI